MEDNKIKKFSVSVIGMEPDHELNGTKLQDWFRQYVPVIVNGQIERMTGYLQPSNFYDGEHENCLSKFDWLFATAHKIQMRILLESDKNFTEEDYINDKMFMDSYADFDQLSLVCMNDELAKRIKKDYPVSTIELSQKKNIKIDDIENYLEIYDYIALSADVEYLKDIKQKDKIRICGNKDTDFDKFYEIGFNLFDIS